MDEGKAAGLVGIGGAVKSLGGNRIGGHLVLFGGPKAKDLEGQYFDAETDFWGLDGKRPAIYHHGFSKAVGRRRLGDVVLKADEAGIWAEGELEARDDYERKILAMAKAGKLGWSSGSAPHLVEVDEGGAIKSWPIVEASLTPTPVDPRTRVVSLKSLLGRKALGGDPPATLADLKQFVAVAGAVRDLPPERRVKLAALARELDSVLGGLRVLLGDSYWDPQVRDEEAEARAVLALL
jgi:hypothetical protein